MFLALFSVYLVVLIAIGWWARSRARLTPEDYFLAGRTFGPLVLFFTMAATNFSAFFFLGFAGSAYKYGFGQYGIMAFGTGFMAIMFFIIGRRVWLLGKTKGYLTPAELIGAHYQSPVLRLLFLGVMIPFTIPYLATQAIGAGLIIQEASGLDFKLGASVAMLVIMFYVLFGGMRGIGWTDVLQGALMFLAMFMAVIFVAQGLGGFSAAGWAAYAKNPMLFSRPGPEGYFSLQLWLSYLLLWVFVDPMFPQLFVRFYAAKDQSSLRWTMILYPILVSFLFLCPVLVGVWGMAAGYAGPSDGVLPFMVKTYAPPMIFYLVMLGALSALMSTADSQLFALATMLAHDLFPTLRVHSVRASQGLVVLLTGFALAFVLFGYDPQVGIMDTLVKTTFSGLVVLFPTVFSALYCSWANKYGAIASILVGELSILLFRQKILPTFGFLDSIGALLISAFVLVLVSWFTQKFHRRAKL